MLDPPFSQRDWIELDVSTETVHGCLVGGRDRATIFSRRINEPCRHQPCPYALIGLGLMETPDEARESYLRKAKLPDETVSRFDLRVYEVSVAEAITATPDPADQADFLHELCHGRAEDPAWSQFRHHKDTYGVEVVRCAGEGRTNALVLRDRAHDLVIIEEVACLMV